MIIATDSLMPCPDIMAGETCDHGHSVCSGIDSLSKGAIAQIVSDILMT